MNDDQGLGRSRGVELAKNTGRLLRAMSMVTGEGDDERRQPSARASGEQENKSLTLHSNSFETRAIRKRSATAAVAKTALEK